MVLNNEKTLVAILRMFFMPTHAKMHIKNYQQRDENLVPAKKNDDRRPMQWIDDVNRHTNSAITTKTHMPRMGATIDFHRILTVTMNVGRID